MTSCLADDVVAAWLDGELADDERAASLQHVVVCARCRELVASMFGSAEPAPPVTIGRYEVVGMLAGGGMGVVLRGRDPVLERAVAIKLAHAALDEGDLQTRMLREAQALARLEHPNVVAVYDCGESGGEVYVAMALVDGMTLPRWLDAAPSLPQRLRVLDDVANGLAAIHDVGLVHRDIKPDNVMVRATGQALIVDFGLARPAAAGAAGSGVAGTRSYVAPEVIAGEPATSASDQFGWWVLAGDVVHDAELTARQRARVDAAIARGTGPIGQRFADMRAATSALRAAITPAWRRPLAIAAGVAAVAAIVALAARGSAPADPCAWQPTAWTAERAGVREALQRAGADADHVLTALDDRATKTATLRRAACELAAQDRPDDRVLGQYRLACLDRTWAETTGQLRALGSREREEVWAALDELGLVVEPGHCVRGARHSIAAPLVGDGASEVTRLGRELARISRDPDLASQDRLARLDQLGAAVAATNHAPLVARWHVYRATSLAQLGKLADAASTLDRSELAAEASGDDDLRTEIAIDRLIHANLTGERETAALEARATALVDKLDNPVRRAELADARAMLLASHGDAPAAVAALREAVAVYDALALDASERAVRTLQNLGAALQLIGDFAGAEQVLDRGLALARRRHGEDGANTLEMRGARAANLLYAGRAEEARRELAAVVAALARKVGTGDRALVMARLVLCQAETEAHATTTVERCREALAGAEAAYGTDHVQLVAYLGMLGNALRIAGKPVEAVSVLQRGLDLGAHGTVSADELTYTRAWLALALHEVDPRDPRARAIAREIVPVLAKLPGTDALRGELATAFADR